MLRPGCPVAAHCSEVAVDVVPLSWLPKQACFSQRPSVSCGVGLSGVRAPRRLAWRVECAARSGALAGPRVASPVQWIRSLGAERVGLQDHRHATGYRRA